MYIGCVALMFYHVSGAFARGRVADQKLNGSLGGVYPRTRPIGEKFPIEMGG